MHELTLILPPETAIKADLDANWAIVAEAYQTILRRNKYENPYEELKKHTRGKVAITEETMHSFIDSLKCAESVKEQMRAITPHTFNGIFVLDH